MISLDRHVAIFLVCCLGFWSATSAAKKPKPIPTTETPLRKLCHRHTEDWTIFTRSFSINTMLSYCESLDANSVTLRRVGQLWARVSAPGGACYNRASWTFDPAEYRYLLRAIFRHHIDVNRDGKMDMRETARYLEPTLRYRLLPGLLDAEYRHLMDAYFIRAQSRNAQLPSEAAFVGAALRMMRAEWPLLVRRTVPDLDGDNCVTQMEFARADCRRRVNEVDLYFRVADLDGNRAVTGPEFEQFVDSTEAEPGEEKGAKAFSDFFSELFRMINTYTVDYYHKTSYAHDQMITFNEINLYICEHVI